ncbi:hypothetical protein FM076_06490 [Streptomyces albus subsp. chlorinus]|uniref:hypothetical protein n=1 Tax=Streptomyces albus TaxID=1888 RepID=UPI00156ECA6A|nr:hypothetical protein [Streptomyces albus]NSC20874.1 hypothetical protein [Streptomyces albus subsp. chlorinus]
MSGSTTETATGARGTETPHAAPRTATLSAAGAQHHPDPGEPVPPQTSASAPVADCTADSAGGLTFDVRLPAARTPAGEAALLLRRRPGASGETEEVRLPLAPVQEAADGTLRAALPSTVRLSEGRWNAFLALPGRQPRRLTPGLNDLRSLVDRVPQENRSWLGVRIPYATKNGNLSIRAWVRWPHAEAGALRVDEGGLELSGRLYGAKVTPTARLEARPRRGEGPPVVAEVRAGDGDARDFTAALPYPPLAVHRLWDLWLRPAEDAEAVRVARILDDVPDKKRIFTYPARPVRPVAGAGAGAGVGDRAGDARTLTARPYYTLNNDLAVAVERAAS